MSLMIRAYTRKDTSRGSAYPSHTTCSIDQDDVDEVKQKRQCIILILQIFFLALLSFLLMHNMATMDKIEQHVYSAKQELIRTISHLDP